MNKNEAKQLAQFLIENYPKNYPKDMGVSRVSALVEDLFETYKEYELAAVMKVFRDWRETSKHTPYPREIIERLGKPKKKDDPNRKHRLCRDSDGCVYDLDLDGGTIIYNPEWDDDDRRVIEYFRRFQE